VTAAPTATAYEFRYLPPSPPSSILALRGGAALSVFRLDKVRDTLEAQSGRRLTLDAEYWHFVDIRAEFNESEQALLQALLNYGPATTVTTSDPPAFLVVPRLGTISPWSSKATDIACYSGLDQVRRIERGVAWYCAEQDSLSTTQRAELQRAAHDAMTESVIRDFDAAASVFEKFDPAPLTTIDVLGQGIEVLHEANSSLGLALSVQEIEYLAAHCRDARRNLTDVELMMFAQVNSEHCRHKIFNADWVIDGTPQDASLFAMIRDTHSHNSAGTIVAYSDNAAVIEGASAGHFYADATSAEYRFSPEPRHFVIKVETHNHPTAIAPFPGAATGSGGEIRDEGATGRGAKPKAGVTGFSVSHLHIPGAAQPWEGTGARPPHLASALQIMLEGPIGGASFNNEFGRPNVAGYFRSFEYRNADHWWGYHKPIMLAGGLGNVRPENVRKETFVAGTHIAVLGGPAMLIGLGGGAASSIASGRGNVELDFASVQRSNPEMERRCQEVIDSCCAQGKDNPILAIHDVGAGGLSNALPELVNGAGRGGHFQLRDIPNDDFGMSPLQVWCNEAQERYVLAVAPERWAEFESICHRERCLYALVGVATADRNLRLDDRYFEADDSDPRRAAPIDIRMDVLLGNPPRMVREVLHKANVTQPFATAAIDIDTAARRILLFPCVADKSFLINIGDRSVTGLIHRDQMVGPWQVPVADAAVTLAGYDTVTGEAIAIGERTPIAALDPAASGRLAIGEVITNIACADIAELADIKLSANWMAAAGAPGQDAALYDTVKAVAGELCIALGISIPVGKDSMAMQTVWHEGDIEHRVVAPVSLIVTGFASIADVRNTVTPQLQRDGPDADLWLIDLGRGQHRLGGSTLAQTYGALGGSVPDVDDPQLLIDFHKAIQALRKARLLLAYHDRSDGGLLATLCEMAFAGRAGVDIDLGVLPGNAASALFCEELGGVVQTPQSDRDEVEALLRAAGVGTYAHRIGTSNSADRIALRVDGEYCLDASRTELHRVWSETTWRMQSLRDNPACAQQEYDRLLDPTDTGLRIELGFDAGDNIAAPYLQSGARPRIAVLREQGVNGHVEMAAAFHCAGFTAVDVTMHDIISGAVGLGEFKGLVACGGFSFGDVLGAGQGWAKSILYQPRAADQFAAFFARTDTFALGVCNGCQMFAGLTGVIHHAKHWPQFGRNLSEQFEARFLNVEIPDNPSVLLRGMVGSILPVVVAHGEGRVDFAAAGNETAAAAENLVALRYVDHAGRATERYPYNPNGSPLGMAGFTTPDGRVTIMMPHPERVYRTVTNSWAPGDWGEHGPWMRMFWNARAWVN